MLDVAWLLGTVVAGLAVVALVARRRARRLHQDDDAWASVRITYKKQADGLFPVGVVRVQNPALVPVIVSASVRSARPGPARWRGTRRAKVRLSVRSPKVRRRSRLPEETLLGAVTGGAARVWELPIGNSRRLPVVRVRVDQGDLRAEVFTWTLAGSPVRAVLETQDRRPALAE